MTSWRSGPLLPCALFLACCALYLLNLDKPPEFDELYHVLAARGFEATGRYAIADGVYLRGWPFTRLVAFLFGLFGEHLWVARLPSLACVAAMAALLFAWLRKEAGTPAALVGAGLFAISPFAIDIAHFARFYGIHGLAFLLGALATYDLAAHPGPRRRDVLRATAALLAFATAAMFQVTTLIGILAIAAWLAVVLAGPWLLDNRVPRTRRLSALAACLVLLALVLAAAAATGLLAKGLAMYRMAPLWSAESANDVAYYHVWLILFYPTLWTLLPVLLVAALAARPRPALFAALLFGIALVLHSFAGSKNLRYVFYVMPFLFALWGIGLAIVAGGLIRLVRSHATLLARQLLPGARTVALAGLMLALAAIWIVAANAAFLRSTLMLADVTIPPELPPVRWELARPVLEPLLAEADIVVVTSELDALYFLGRYDVLVSRSRIDERPGKNTPDFALDTRTGRPIIAQPGSLARLMSCYRKGIVVTSTYRWRKAPMLDDAMADLIVRRATPVDLPRASRVLAFTWDSPPATAAADCPAIPSAGAGRPVAAAPG